MFFRGNLNELLVINGVQVNHMIFMLQRPEKYLGDLETWEKAESSLAEALNEFGKPWEVSYRSCMS